LEKLKMKKNIIEEKIINGNNYQKLKECEYITAYRPNSISDK